MNMTAAFALALIVLGAANDAIAQSPVFEGLQLKGLPVVYVTERTGRETAGRLVSLTESALVVNVSGADQTFNPADVVRIERRGDSLKNGAIIGAAFGLITGAMLNECAGGGSGPRGEGCPGARIGLALGGAAIWAAIGAGIDALIPGRTRIWPARGK